MSIGTEHPEEKTHLCKVVDFIDGEVSRMRSQSPAKAAYQPTATLLQANSDELARQYNLARPRRYFGRIDFIPAEFKTEERKP